MSMLEAPSSAPKGERGFKIIASKLKGSQGSVPGSAQELSPFPPVRESLSCAASSFEQRTQQIRLLCVYLLMFGWLVLVWVSACYSLGT